MSGLWKTKVRREGGAGPQLGGHADEFDQTDANMDRCSSIDIPSLSVKECDWADFLADDADYEDINDAHQTTLAKRQARVECLYNDNPAALIVSLKVFSDPNNYASRLRYCTRLELTYKAINEWHGNRRQNNIVGHIEAWRIVKPAPNLPGVNNAWVKELLANKEKEAETYETALCMRALFTRVGEPKTALGKYTAQIRDDPIMFVQTIYIRCHFRQKGLLSPSLDGFYTTLGGLPKDFAFAGNLVLVPGPLDISIATAWRGMDVNEVERRLTTTYLNRGYAVWIKNARVGGNIISVMGRKVR